MGSSTPAAQTVTSKTDVDPLTQQWRSAVFDSGTNLYNQGSPGYYPGQTVAPYTQQTLTGLNMLENQAAQGAPGLNQAYQSSQRAMSGYTPGMNTAMQASNGGMQNPYQSLMYQTSQQGVAPQIAGQLNQSSQMNPYAAQVAGAGEQQTQMGVNSLNSFSNQNLSHLDGLYSQGREQITNDLNARFAGAGRTGANAAYAQQLGGQLGNLYTGIYAPGVEAAQNRQLSAAGQLAGIDQGNRAAQMQGYDSAGGMYANAQGMGLQAAGMYGDFLNQDASRAYQGATGLAGLSEANSDRRLQGAQLAGNMWSQGNSDAAQASALLPSLYQYGSQPGQAMLGVGGAYEQMNQAQIDADMARYNYGQNADWQNLQRYAGLMTGLPDFSSQTQTTTGAGTNRGMSLLGGAATGAGVGASFGPWGAGIGAGVGALTSLFR